MKRWIILTLVWRLWCEGIARVGLDDTSAECWHTIATAIVNADNCVDTRHGPRIGGLAFSDDYHTCAAWRHAWSTCQCKPEIVE